LSITHRKNFRRRLEAQKADEKDAQRTEALAKIIGVDGVVGGSSEEEGLENDEDGANEDLAIQPLSQNNPEDEKEETTPDDPNLPLPIWNPDTSYSKLIHRVIDESGTAGIKTTVSILNSPRRDIFLTTTGFTKQGVGKILPSSCRIVDESTHRRLGTLSTTSPQAPWYYPRYQHH
jgi:hypothetical protein